MERVFFAVLMIALLSASALAAVKPNGLFSDNTVLQQGVRLPVWGTAGDGEKVTIEFQGQKVSTTACAGRWIAYLEPLKAGGPFTMRINNLEIRNVLVGEVWLCSGQSNMVWTLGKSENAQAEVEAARDPMMRLYTVPRSDRFQKDLPPAWQECSPETTAPFSAVAYYFGKHLRETLNVPVGLINASVGSSRVESWTSYRTLRTLPGFKTEARKYYLYNGMISPLIPYAIKGVAWYQGENSAPWAYEYRSLLPLMIRDWRSAWGRDDLPFLIVQIAPYGRAILPGSWPELREAQLLTVQQTPNTALIVTSDVGEETNVHPIKKEPVGARLALAARAIAYGEKVPYSGPVYKSLEVKDGKAILTFDHIEGGLVAKDGPLRGFTIAGEDRKFIPANAEIRGDKVIVTSPDVLNPIAVHYGWSDWMDVNLYNQSNLPATPFRTDAWDMLTMPK